MFFTRALALAGALFVSYYYGLLII